VLVLGAAVTGDAVVDVRDPVLPVLSLHARALVLVAAEAGEGREGPADVARLAGDVVRPGQAEEAAVVEAHRLPGADRVALTAGLGHVAMELVAGSGMAAAAVSAHVRL
jgi:hypothetical protein